MKVINSENSMIIYLNKFYVENIDFTEKSTLKRHFKDLFSKLQNFYNISLNGYYLVDVYLDEYYGSVIEIEKEDIDCFEYFDNQVDMKVSVEPKEFFLYEIEDYFLINQSIIDKINIYQYKNKLYIKLNNNLSNSQFGQLLEISNIVHKNKREIINYGKLLKI